MQEKRKKNARKMKNTSPTRENHFILHYALGKNVSWLYFFSSFGTFEVTKTQIQRIA